MHKLRILSGGRTARRQPSLRRPVVWLRWAVLLLLVAHNTAFGLAQSGAQEPTAAKAVFAPPVPPHPTPRGPAFRFSSGYIPPVCLRYLKSEQLVDCWLTQHRTIAQSIVWWFKGDASAKDWTQWNEPAKQDLRLAFKNAATWLQNGMSNYPGTLVQDPPVNLTDAQLSQGFPAYVIFAEQDAWNIYLGEVGLSLAAEIYGYVPWSLRNYDAVSLHHLFNAVRGNLPFSNSTNSTRFWPSEILAPNAPSGYINWGTAPANATYVFKFLKDNNLLQATPKETIASLLQWSQQLWHHIGDNGSLNSYQHWQYYGGPTISRVIEGTVNLSLPDYGIQHWTKGCGGTSAFLTAVLRAANIPSLPVNVGKHGSIWFSGEKQFLSHGDDPYDRVTKAYPTAELPIDEQTYFDWFINLRPSLANLNVGRRPLDLAIKYPGTYLVEKYCQDVASGADHAAGKVYEFYSHLAFAGYSVAMLEAAGLWTTLHQKAVASGTCNPDAY